MKKRIIILASVFLLTGCSGNTPSDDAPDVTNASSLSNLSGESSQGTPGAEQSGNVRTSEAATEEITVGYVTYEAADVGGEPVIADNNSTFYRYAGKRWWVDYSEPAAEFVLRGGKYFRSSTPRTNPPRRRSGGGLRDISDRGELQRRRLEIHRRHKTRWSGQPEVFLYLPGRRDYTPVFRGRRLHRSRRK